MKKFVSFIVLITFIYSLGINTALTYGVEYKQYDKKKLKDWLDQAKDSKDEASYNKLAGTGSNIVLGEWENGFMELLKEQGGDGSNKDTIKNELTQEINNTIAQNKKTWAAQQRARSIWTANKDKIKDYQNSIDSATQGFINDFYNGRTQGVADAFAGVEQKKKELKDTLSGSYLEGLDQGISDTLSVIMNEWDSQLGNMQTLGKNRAIYETVADVYSLKKNSDMGSAGVISDQIIGKLQGNLKEIESSIFNLQTQAANIAEVGKETNLDNYSIAIRQQLDQGINAWNSIIDDTKNQVIAKIQQGQDFLQDGISQWNNAINQLEQQRNDWVSKMQSQMEQGNSQWGTQENELNNNLGNMQQQLQGYLQQKQSSWNQ